MNGLTPIAGKGRSTESVDRPASSPPPGWPDTDPVGPSRSSLPAIQPGPASAGRREGLLLQPAHLAQPARLAKEPGEAHGGTKFVAPCGGVVPPSAQ
jgi:hypothetical protein